VEDDIDVSQYERKNENSRIIAVFQKDEARFPHPHLKLQNNTLLIDKFHSKIE